MALDFSRNYSPPGVYIEESESTLVNIAGIPPTLVGIVGPGTGYQTNIEQVTLDSDDGVTLAKKGIDAASVVVTVVATGDTVPGTDYTVTKIGSDPGQDYYSSFTAVAEPSVDPGTAVFVTYRYTDPTYFAPKSFTSFEDVKDIYGEPLNTQPVGASVDSYEYVTSPLSLAAMLAFANGATQVVLCPTTLPPAEATTDSAKSTARKDALRLAMAKLEAVTSVNVVVALPTGVSEADATTVLTEFSAALNSAATQKTPRFGIIGFEPGMEDGPDELLATSGTKQRRMMLAYAGPNGLLMYSGAANSTFSVGHEYLGAAYAGRMAALPVQYSLTKQVLAGFRGLAGTPIANSLKNQYASAGVAVVEADRFNRLSVRHGVTTDTTNVNTREASVVRAKDLLVIALDEGTTTSGLIGAPLDADLLLSVKSAVQGVLDSAVSDETINSYTGLTVRQVDNDPSVIEVKFAYKPAYPLNYIVISFSIDMSSGTTDLTDDTVA